MTEQPIGPILDGLGVTIDLEDGDLIESAVVLLKTVDSSGAVGVEIANSAGMDWLAQLALITAAQRIVDDHDFDCRGDD